MSVFDAWVQMRTSQPLLWAGALRLFLFLCLFPACVRASEWRLVGLQGLAVRSLAAAPDRLYAGTEGQGVFYLDLAGRGSVWRSLGLDGVTVTGLWADRLRPGLVIAATDGQFATILLFRTLDGGQNWEPLGSGVPFPSSGVRVMSRIQGVAGSVTLFGAGGAVWRSDDFGESWTEVFPRGGRSSLEVAPSDAATIWAGGTSGRVPSGDIALSRDGGVTWRQVWSADGSGPGATTDIAAHPRIDGLALTGHDGFVQRTEDHGAAFHTVLDAPGLFFLDWDGANPSRAYAVRSSSGGDGETYLSQDLGRTWVSMKGTTLRGLIVRDLKADEHRLGVVYAATNNGVYSLAASTTSGSLSHDTKNAAGAGEPASTVTLIRW